MNPPVPVYMKYYFFHVENPEDVKIGQIVFFSFHDKAIEFIFLRMNFILKLISVISRLIVMFNQFKYYTNL